MAQVSSVVSADLTSREATPVIMSAAGEGAPGRLKHVDGYVTTVAADSANSVYSLVRIPSNAKVKRVMLDADADGGTGAIDIGVYLGTKGFGGGHAATGRLYNDASQIASGQALFGSAVVISSAVRAVDVTNESGSYTSDKRMQPLWKAAGLASDPGGFIDICATVTAAITNAGKVAVQVEYAI